MKPDERKLLDEVRRREGGPAGSPREVAAEIGMSPRRCLLLCQGWWAKHWLERNLEAERGADFVTGRLTAAGMTADG